MSDFGELLDRVDDNCGRRDAGEVLEIFDDCSKEANEEREFKRCAERKGIDDYEKCL